MATKEPRITIVITNELRDLIIKEAVKRNKNNPSMSLTCKSIIEQHFLGKSLFEGGQQ